MPTQILYIVNSTTERRTIIGGASPEQHRELIALDYTHDRLANQYRRTQKQPSTYRDGVLIQGGEPVQQLAEPSVAVPGQIVYLERSHTERRTYTGGLTVDQHRKLIAEGFRHDRLSNQYRKTDWERGTYIDGVLMQDESEVVASDAAA
jgi:hypothetical protein